MPTWLISEPEINLIRDCLSDSGLACDEDFAHGRIEL